MSQEVIRLVDIKKHYKVGTEVVKALQSVSLTVNRNEYVALMGASGSGKSTLMNILGCLDTPSGGQYFLAGDDVSKLGDNELAEIRNRADLILVVATDVAKIAPRFAERCLRSSTASTREVLCGARPFLNSSRNFMGWISVLPSSTNVWSS